MSIVVNKPEWVSAEDWRRAAPSRAFRDLPPHKRALHLGGHLGREAEFYQDVVFVEPLPRHAQHLRDQELCVVEAAIGGNRLHVTTYDQGSSVLEPLQHRVAESIEVRETSLGELNDGTFDLLVLDIQGMELQALKSGSLTFRYILVETSERPRYRGAASRQEIQNYLESQGYQLRKKYPHGPHDIMDLLFEKRKNSNEHGIDR